MTAILANATVDILVPTTPQKFGQFVVDVWGQPPYDYTKSYVIQARDNTSAAQQGIHKFVEEAEALGPKRN